MLSDLDRGILEGEYRIGKATIRELAERHKVDPKTITRLAKKHGWVRDLSELVELGARAEMDEAAFQKAKEPAPEGKAPIKKPSKPALTVVEAAIHQRVGILTKHQVIAADMLGSVIQMHDELVQSGKDRVDILALIELIKEDDPSAASELRKASSLSGRSMTLKTLTDSLARLIEQERKAHGIKDEEDRHGDRADMDELLLLMHKEMK